MRSSVRLFGPLPFTENDGYAADRSTYAVAENNASGGNLPKFSGSGGNTFPSKYSRYFVLSAALYPGNSSYEMCPSGHTPPTSPRLMSRPWNTDATKTFSNSFVKHRSFEESVNCESTAGALAASSIGCDSVTMLQSDGMLQVFMAANGKALFKLNPPYANRLP